MSTQRNQLFAFLDNELGPAAGNTFADYDSKEALLSYAVEAVSVQDNLMCGCGVGPLMGDLEAWVAAFEAGERDDPQEPFCLKIQFDPADQGYVLYRTETEFLGYYPKPLYGHYRPQPWHAPDRYPVFARELATLDNPNGADHVILSYLYYDEMTLVP